MPEEKQLLSKLFRTTEELTEAEISHINGEIPDWVHGTYIRVGPGKFDLEPDFTMNHWLDGFSILSRFVIEGEKVSFEKRFLQSEAYKRGIVAKKPVFCEYGTHAYPDPTKGIFSRLVTSLLPFELTDNDTLSLFKLGNDIFVSSETNYFHAIDPCNLHSGERYDANKYFGLNICSAHPLTDEDDGITYQLGSTLLTGSKYHFIKIPSVTSSNQSSKELFKKSKTLCTIPSHLTGCLSFNHSFGMTKNYLIFIEQPYLVNVTKLISSVIKGNHTFKDLLEWRPEVGNHFYLIEKKTGKIINSKINIISKNPFFFLHFINCYEDKNDNIIIDVNAYPNVSIFDSMFLNRLRNGIVTVDIDDQPSAQRFIIPITPIENNNIKNYSEEINLISQIKSEALAIRHGHKIILTPEALSKQGCELPMINKKFIGKNYRYIYLTGSAAPGFFKNAIGKVDVKKKETLLWKESISYYPGEPMFIPNPNSKFSGGETTSSSEDDGVLISAVTDVSSNESNDFIVFLDAKTMKEIGRAQFNAHIPQAIHGIFLEST